VTAAYDNYVTVLETGSVEALEAYADELPVGPAYLGAGRQFSAVNWLV
jgi:hypothetical protein